MSFESLLDKTGTIRRATSVTTSPSGEETKHYTDKYLNVPCDLQVQSGGLANYAFGTMVEENSKAFFLPTVDIQEDDQFVCDGKTYTVLFVERKRDHHLEVYLHSGLRRQ